jgi:hypothetical protein
MGQTVILVPESEAQELALEVARWEDDGGFAVDISYKIIRNMKASPDRSWIYRVTNNNELLQDLGSEIQTVR